MNIRTHMLTAACGPLLALLAGLGTGATVHAGEAPPPAQTPGPATKTAPQPVEKAAPRMAPVLPVTPPQAQPVPETPADIKDMTNPRYLVDLAQVHSRYGALDRAEELLRKAQPLAKDPETKAQVNAALALLLQRKQDYKGATTCLEEAIGQLPEGTARSQYMMTLADLYSQQKDYDKAEKQLNELSAHISGAKAKPEDGWLRAAVNQRLAMLWQKQEGKLDKVTAAAEETLAKDPQNTDALERLATVYASGRRDPAKAIPVYEKLLQQKPKNLMLLNRLATACQDAMQYDKAVETQRAILALDPKNIGAVYQVAQSLLLSGKKDEAVKWAKEQIPTEGAASYNISTLAGLYEQADMLAEAEDARAKMRDLVQHPLQKAECTLRIADLARRRKDYKRAEEELQKVLKLEGPETKGLVQRAKNLQTLVQQEQTAPPPPPPPPPAPPAKK